MLLCIAFILLNAVSETYQTDCKGGIIKAEFQIIQTSKAAYASTVSLVTAQFKAFMSYIIQNPQASSDCLGTQSTTMDAQVLRTGADSVDYRGDTGRAQPSYPPKV